MTDLRIGSLFTGTGALDMAVMDTLGGSVAWHCQYDPEDKHQYAARILEHHWPDVPNHGDITAVDWIQVEPIDVLTAGFPCQDLSYAGRGAGIQEGTRSGLWYAVEEAARTLRPRLIVLENVAAIVTRRPGLDVVLAGLAELGLDAEWRCVRAADRGAPHKRNRWFCVAGNPDGLAWAASRAFGGRPGQVDEPSPVERIVRPDRAHVAPDTDRGSLRKQPVAEPGRSGEAFSQLGQQVAADTSSDRREWSQERHSGAPEPGLEAPLGDDAERRLLACGQYGPAVARWEHILGRRAPSPVDDRGRLDPRFVEWMMGLPGGHVCDVPAPDGMTAAGLRNARLKALGNGVVRQQAAYALRLLLDRIGREVAA